MPVTFPTVARFPGDNQRGLNLNLPFPRIATVNGYGAAAVPQPPDPVAFARFGLIICASLATDPTSLRAAAPGSIILAYFDSSQVQVNGVATGVPFNGIVVDPRWWMTNAGTQLNAALTNVAGSFTCNTPVVAWPSTPFALQVTDKTNYEVMNCTAVASAGGVDTLTVTRNVWNSVGTAFATGARVAALSRVGSSSTVYWANITPFCPRDGTNRQWVDYASQFIQTQLGTFPGYDGVFLDAANQFFNPSPNSADADQNNQIDPVPGDGPTPGPTIVTSAGVLVTVAPQAGIENHLNQLVNRLRNLTSNAPKVILTNGSGYPYNTDGMFHEVWDTDFFGNPGPYHHSYKMFNAINTTTKDTAQYPVTILNEVAISSGSAVTGANTNPYTYNFQNMRFMLAAACMGNGFAVYDWSTLFHGQTWMFDEQYKALGTALTAPVLTTDTQLSVVSSASFNVGDVIRVPHAVKSTNYPSYNGSNTGDELMTVTAIPNSTTLTVTRNDPVKGTQIVGTAVFTQAMVNKGIGWLGQPKANAIMNTALLSTINHPTVTNPGFETSAIVAGTSNPVQSTFTGWGLAPNASAGNQPPQALYVADTTTFHSGTQSLKISSVVPTISGGAFTYFNVKVTQLVTANVASSGIPVIISFWAKGTKNQIIALRYMDHTGVTTYGQQQWWITNEWTQYYMVATSTADATGIFLAFNLSGYPGDVWLDDVNVYFGNAVTDDPFTFTRDFDNGLVVMNGTNNPQSIVLPSITGPYTNYKKLQGSQDTINNNGTVIAPGNTILVSSLDALFLMKIP